MIHARTAAPALLLALAALAGCERTDEVAAAGTPELAAVERRDLDVSVEAAGQIEPVRVVEVKSKASGEVLRLHVDTGDEVAAGDLLAEIDPRDVRNALAQAEADLEVARATLATASAQRRRMQALLEAQAVTEQEYEDASLAEANARAQLVKAQTNLELARERRRDVTITAPLAGSVLEKSVEVGTIIASASSNVSGGTTLLKMADLSEMRVRALVDETDIGRVTAGQPAVVTVEAHPGRAFRGLVEKIEPQAVVDQNVTMFPVLVALDNPEGLLKPGMNAEVEIEIARREDVLTVPSGAVVSPREAAGTAEALGLDPERVAATLGRGAGRPTGGRGGLGATAPADAAPGGTAAPEQGAPNAARPAAAAGEAAASPERGRTEEAAVPREGGRTAGAGRPEPSSQATPGAVFVWGAEGAEPRRVTLGVSDWDYAEVISGLAEGEQVVLVSVARLQAQQREFEDRVRSRTVNPFSSGNRQSGGQGAQGGAAGGASRGTAR